MPWIKTTSGPLSEGVVFLVSRIRDGSEKIRIAKSTTDILGRTGVLSLLTTD